MSICPSGFRLVIIDDNHGDIVLLQEAITESKHPIEVIAFTSAAQALAELPGMPPADLVLSDINMPMMNGSEFIERLRAVMQSRKTTFVLMSSLVDQDLPITTRHHNEGVAYIRKGVTWGDYRAIVNALYRRMVSRRTMTDRSLP